MNKRKRKGNDGGKSTKKEVEVKRKGKLGRKRRNNYLFPL